MKHRSALSSAFLVLTICAVMVAAAPSDAAKRKLRSSGVVETGPNDRCGEAIWSFPAVAPGPASHGTLLGKHDSDALATDALALSASDCGADGDLNALLATTTDAAFFAERGWSDPNVALKNLNLRQVPIPAGNGVYAPIPFAGAVPPNPLPPTIAEPSSAISLGVWLRAKGTLKITCDDDDGTASVKLGLGRLVPHGVYTVWGVWLQPDTSLLTVPFGGLPNLIVPNKTGKAKLQRELAFCPLDFAPDGSLLMLVSVAYHADGVTHGAVPAEPFDTRAFVGVGGLPFQSTIPMGIVTFDHVGFRVNADDIP